MFVFFLKTLLRYNICTNTISQPCEALSHLRQSIEATNFGAPGWSSFSFIGTRQHLMNPTYHLARQALAKAGIVLSLALITGASFARQMVDESALGLTEAALLLQFPGLRQLDKPISGPHGLRARWSLSPEPWADGLFDSLFFVKEGRVTRIERRWRSLQAACRKQSPYPTIVEELTARLGAELESSDSDADESHQASAWNQPSFIVVSYFASSAGQCSIRVVYEARELKDASDL